MIPLLLLLLAAAPDSGPEAPALPAEETAESSRGEGTTPEPEEESFLDPYYAAEDSSSGSSDEGGGSSGCWDLVDLPGILTEIRLSHHADPFRSGGVRTVSGDRGNPFGFSASAGISRIEDARGLVAGARLLTPCPVGIDVLVHRVPSAERETFSLLYAGMPIQLTCGLPLQLALGPELVFPREGGRYTLTGAGAILAADWFFLDSGGLSLDCRLAWVNRLPLHRVAVRLSWYTLPGELWAGVVLLRNSAGEILSGPSAGVGVLL